MSGGYFDYQDSYLEGIAERMDELIKDQEAEQCHERYDPEALAIFKDAATQLHRLSIVVHRVDWLVSGDDGEDSFFERLEEDLKKIGGF